MKRLPIALLAWPLVYCTAYAQTSVSMPSPPATSPLGTASDAGVGGTGLPLGATEITSPGVSPLFMASPGTAATTGVSCANPGTSLAMGSGSAGIFDGGGTSPGAVGPPQSMRPPRMSTSCGAAAASSVASSAPGGGNGVGIPLGATQLGNLGVSPADPVPTIGMAPVTGGGITIVTPSTPAIAPAVPLETIGGISSLPPPPVPGLAPGNIRHR
jgi:hypothetical protein